MNEYKSFNVIADGIVKINTRNRGIMHNTRAKPIMPRMRMIKVGRTLKYYSKGQTFIIYYSSYERRS